MNDVYWLCVWQCYVVDMGEVHIGRVSSASFACITDIEFLDIPTPSFWKLDSGRCYAINHDHDDVAHWFAWYVTERSWRIRHGRRSEFWNHWPYLFLTLLPAGCITETETKEEAEETGTNTFSPLHDLMWHMWMWLIGLFECCRKNSQWLTQEVCRKKISGRGRLCV